LGGYRFLVEGLQVDEGTDIFPEEFYYFALREDANDFGRGRILGDGDSVHPRGHDLDDLGEGIACRQRDKRVLHPDIPYQTHRDIMIPPTGLFHEILE
jgi:hypothetical protein